MTGDAKAEQYELFVRDDATNEIVFKSGWQPVQLAGEAMRDITTDPLKIALKLSKGGKFTLLLVGVIGNLEDGRPAPGATQMFWASRVSVGGTEYVDAKLLTVQPGDDQDGDLWPDGPAFLQHTPGASDLYRDKGDVLDCDDKVDDPQSPTGVTVMLKASQINPFAAETCGDGFDENCNGNDDDPCVDNDGDGDFAGSDCDDADPKRHHANAKDPFPDPPNCCGYSLGKGGTPDEHKDFTGDAQLCPTKRCGDGVDESCRGGATNDPGNDTACVIDADCDGFPAAPQGTDCNDADPSVHPGAPEICGNGIDENCNGVVDDGCQPCDLDGDGYERNDAANGCPDKNDKHPGMFDCNDYDSGVFPGQTATFGNKEGGANALAMQQSALRGDCRHEYEDTVVTMPTPKIGAFGQVPGDADCNGMAYEGCPSQACDADGDGFPNATAGCNPNNVAVDCNDADPTIYPGAPDKCGDAIAENCVADMPCGTNDKDGDKYLPPFDCDDNNAAVHPWAAELCNGIDDDCDTLVDEGNPDPSGKPLVANGAIIVCTDSDVGECAKQTGVCVCSAAMENAKYDPNGKRMFCPGEQSGGMKPPHCFGAGQPKPQSCDSSSPKDDDCDGRVDDPAGVNLAVKGMPCGITVGQCKAGIVVGCDMTKTNCFSQFNRIPSTQSWYVCSTDTVCPQAELCNGLDDDCDGQLAGAVTPPIPGQSTADERDHDADKYLACAGCDPAKLATGLIGCGDCDDTRPGVHPGAPELCDNVDNDCNPGTADGKDQCGQGAYAGLPNCCSSQATCRNLATDVNNCVNCGNVCDPLKANACGGAGCMCGGSPACGTSSYCNAGTCSPCNNNTHCGPSCVNCGAGAVCKSDGSGCTQCNLDTDCPSTSYCNSGSCVPRQPQGGRCSADNNCLQPPNSGIPLYCTDGYCCNESPATCNGCRTCARNPGTCSNVAAGSDPHNYCTANTAACTGDTCNGGGSCAVANGSVCSGPVCAAGTQTMSTCQGGTCTPQTPISCSPYLCSGAICGSSCTLDTQCAAGYYCANPTCQQQKGAGASCSRNGECGTGHCVDNVCCNVAACGSCQACGAGGNCQTVTNAQDPDTCAGNNICDASGACKLKNGVAGCGADSSASTQCASGFCYQNVCCNQACPSNITCSTGTQASTQSCAAPTAGVCTTSTTNCTNNYSCTPGTGCNASCTCTTAPCISPMCSGGYYCTAPTCTACTVNSFCGATCDNCAGGAIADGKSCINNGGTFACGCTSIADCDATKADSCGTLNGKTVCKCGNGAACGIGVSCNGSGQCK